MKHLTLLAIWVICLSTYGFGQQECYTNDGVATVWFGSDFCPEGELITVVEDHFDDENINYMLWNPITGVPEDNEFEGTKQYYKSANVTVENGKLLLTAEREQLNNQIHGWSGEFTDDFEFTSGRIHSLQEFGYGEYEVKCKLPDGGTKGFWIAIWGYSDNTSGWNEFDFEILSSDNEQSNPQEWPLTKVKLSSHSNDNGSHTLCTNLYDMENSLPDNTDLGSDFHIYTFVYRPDYIEWKIDGVVVQRTWYMYSMLGQYGIGCNQFNFGTQYAQNKAFPKQPMNFKIQLSLETPVENLSPNSSSNLPNDLQIEHIKIRQYVPCNGQVTINSQSELDALIASTTGYFNVILGESVYIDNCTLPSGVFLKVLSSGNIVFGSNFETEQGSYLETKLLSENPCNSQSPMSEETESSYSLWHRLSEKSSVLDRVSEIPFDIQNDELSKEISISPVPLCQNDLRIQSSLTDPIRRIFVINNSGKLIKEYSINQFDMSDIELNTESWGGDGVYYLRIRTENGNNEVKRIVKF